MKANSIQSISWQEDHVRILDQTKLPVQEVYLECRDLESIAAAIQRLSIRGAPAIGVAAAMGFAFACRQSTAQNNDEFFRHLDQIYERLLGTRPTAVNLRWALERMLSLARQHSSAGIEVLQDILKQEALKILNEDIEINRRMGRLGQEVVPDQATIITICNTGSLATAGHGTALGVIRSAVEQGKNVCVAACETRPLLQGARLTAWELKKDGIPFELITDGMAGHFMKTRGADLVIAGSDRIAANGDAANKIGTYALAILAQEHGIPFYIAAPVSTIDGSTQSGDKIPIEERSGEEVISVRGTQIAPESIKVWNPAFDVVPNKYIAGIMTEKGILRPPFQESIHKALTDKNN